MTDLSSLRTPLSGSAAASTVKLRRMLSSSMPSGVTSDAIRARFFVDFLLTAVTSPVACACFSAFFSSWVVFEKCTPSGVRISNSSPG